MQVCGVDCKGITVNGTSLEIDDRGASTFQASHMRQQQRICAGPAHSDASRLRAWVRLILAATASVRSAVSVPCRGVTGTPHSLHASQPVACGDL